FFFQAEDGIRDGHVTGVQTCALPISAARYESKAFPWIRIELLFDAPPSLTAPMLTGFVAPFLFFPPSIVRLSRFASRTAGAAMRSEERRVGKEGRVRLVSDY